LYLYSNKILFKKFFEPFLNSSRILAKLDFNECFLTLEPITKIGGKQYSTIAFIFNSDWGLLGIGSKDRSYQKPILNQYLDNDLDNNFNWG
jgi:hypothetical protein